MTKHMITSTSTYNNVIIKTSKELIVTSLSKNLIVSWATMNRITTRTPIYPIHTLFSKDQIRHIFPEYLIVYEKVSCLSLYEVLVVGSNNESTPLYHIFTIFTFNTQVFCW